MSTDLKMSEFPLATDPDLATDFIPLVRMVGGVPANMILSISDLALGPGGGGPGGDVFSVFGRIGNVIAQAGDYNWNQIAGTVLPAVSGANLTNLNAAQLSTGTIPDARFPATLPAVSGANLTNLNANNLASGLIPAARIPFAAPSTPIGLTAVAGSGGSVMRADAAPAISQSIAPTWTSNHTFSVSITTPKIVAGAGLEVTGDLRLSATPARLLFRDTSTGWTSSTTTVITLLNNNAVRSPNYTSGLVGWNIDALGDAEFNNITARGALRSSIFFYNAIQASAGTQIISYAAKRLRAALTIPASPTYGTTTVQVDTDDIEGLSHAASQLAAVGHVLRVKDGLIGDTWLKISSISDQTTFWRYTCLIMAGSNNVTYGKGLALVNYGGTFGFITLSADGGVGSSPNISMATHSSTFSSLSVSGSLLLTPQVRIGNLNGSYGFATDTFGFAAGQYGTVGQSWIIVDATNGVRIGNNTTTLTQIDSAGNASFSGSITSSAGTIAGWTIQATRLSSGTTHLSSGFDPPAGQVAWLGKSATAGPFQGMILRDSAGRNISMIAGYDNGTNTVYPFLQLHDGTRERIVLGGLNNAWGADGSVNAFGMKCWDAAGAKLLEFSDSQNILAGWTISAAQISSTGININSGASASLAFGTTPPTSATVGTGIWFDRTGLYGLVSNVLKVKLDAATGQIEVGRGGAGWGRTVLKEAGITLEEETNLPIIEWKKISTSNQSLKISAATGDAAIDAHGEASGGIAPAGRLLLRATNNGNTQQTVLNLSGLTSSAFANLYGTGFTGLQIATTGSPPAFAASAALEIVSTIGAVLFPRMNSTQRDALTPSDGMVIYNTSTNKLQVRAAAAWVDLH